ncbi:hypothetical protein IT397_01250 [Candidatus Nomurabacteria bacterium]|nr:hypothetical protein [Candidatus Nomurabacteria bacterium]
MTEVEFEKTYLIKTMPDGWQSFQNKEIFDIYFPFKEVHPNLRVRKAGDKYDITKKECINGNDSSEQNEHTIKLTSPEFEALKNLEGKKLRKIRYYFDLNGIRGELGVHKDELEGLVLVDFEFKNREEMERFVMPDFCLADVTQEEFVAGGMLCGKKYSDVEDYLLKYGYKRMSC